MSNIAQLEQGLRNRLWVIDIPLHYRDPLVGLILKWSQESGIEWTIKRLKSLKVDLYRRRAGLPPLTWVRKNRRGDIAGCLGGLFRWADKSDKNFRKVVQTLMCYTVFTYSKPTESQVKKFTEALACAPPPKWEGSDRFHKSVRSIFGGLTVDRSEKISLLTYRGSPTKRKPSRGLTSVSQDSDILGDAEVILSSEWGRNLVDKYGALFRPILHGLSIKPVGGMFPFTGTIDPYQVIGGKIAFIQEPGGKLRSVASPMILYQLALRHFGKAVYAFARHLPWDCTHDQSKPVRTLQAALKDGRTVFSVDLSSATDYFPLEVQVNCMRAIFGNTNSSAFREFAGHSAYEPLTALENGDLDIDLFETISRSNWVSPLGVIRWNRGQPLGLFPSFAVFTVTHGMLLWYLNGCKWNEDFFVLGDDVVILDPTLHRNYIQILEEWKCPYSPDKSLSSNQICEFAGKVFTSELIIPQFKWREMSNNNFVDIARQLGHRSYVLLSKRQKEVFDAIKHLTLPLGLNFSFEGSSLCEMESLTQQTLGILEPRILDSLTDLAGVIQKNLYGSNVTPPDRFLSKTSVSLPEVLKEIATFDEKVRRVLSELLPWYRSCIDPRNYSGVPGGLGSSELPPVQLQPSNRTTLDRYRQLLGLSP